MSGELAKALVAAQKEMPKVEADAVNPHFKSRFTSLDHLIAKTRPILAKHGLAIVQEPCSLAWEGETPQPALRTSLVHEAGEIRESVMPLLLGGQDMQKLGAAITYARRYAWAALLGISEQEDDDGNAASTPAKNPVEEKTPAKPAARSAGTPVAAAAPEEGPAAATPTAAQLTALYKLVEEKGGDKSGTMAAAATAEERGQVVLASWYAKAKAHWDAQPVPFKAPDSVTGKAA